MQRKTVVFTFPPYEYLATQWFSGPSYVPGSFSISRFANKEVQLSVQSSVANRSCLIVGSLSPPEENLFSFLILSHTLKKEGAKKVSAFIPYLAYSRQENEEPHKSQIAGLVGRLLKASGIDEVITVDVHSPLIKKLFPVPLHSLSPSPLFAEMIKSLSWPSCTLVAPDQGAITRCEEAAALLHGSKEIVWVSKTRHAKGVSHSTISGKVQERVVIIDDILDTGQTVISCCKKLIKEGALEIIVMVTHGLFTGTAWKKLWNLGVKKIYCTDTVPLCPRVRHEAHIFVLPIQSLKEVFHGKAHTHSCGPNDHGRDAFHP